jgi:Ni/Fe-hydrogenase subunit HybB-like protein
MSETWKRNVPVFDIPIITRSFLVLSAISIITCVLVIYREVVGLGAVSGMNDMYAWGIWKAFNVMVLTGLGTGSFSIGIATWIFRRHRLHSVMRTAVLTSFLVYASGLVLLGVDIGRPWNFLWIMLPWKWNAHSPMLEIAFCMPLYTAVPLLFENIPAVLEWVHDRCPELQSLVELTEKIMRRIFPWMLGLGFLLPALHQSSLGALMLLAGSQVHPLWQTPWMPLLYVWAASFMGSAFVTAVLLVCHLVWKRPIDNEVLHELSRMTAILIATWLVFRFADLAFSGKLPLTIGMATPCLLFWMETIMLAMAAAMLAFAGRRYNIRLIFQGSLLAAVAGMLYRYDPTTLVFNPRVAAFYFPSAMEMLIDIGFLSMAVAAFCVLAKAMAILPASTRIWHAMEAAQWKRPAIQLEDADYRKYAAAD